MNEIDILYLLLLIVVSKLKRIGINISLHNKSNDHREEKKGTKKVKQRIEKYFCAIFSSVQVYLGTFT